MRIVVAITGASGAIYGVRLLEVLAERGDVETHLVITAAGRLTLLEETDRSVADLHALADVVHREHDIGASIASGSFPTDGMVVMPCSVKTLSGIANSYASTLVIRAADVHLKERRPLVLVVRETPLHLGHIRLMAAATEAGAVIVPPMPAFYSNPQTIGDIVDQTVAKVMEQLGLKTSLGVHWLGRSAQELELP